MDNPGAIQLTLGGGAFSVSQPGTFIGDWIADLGGMVAATLQAQFAYGGGGVSATLYLQTSIDQGDTPIDIACLQFGTAPETEIVNFSALTPKTSPYEPTQQGLAANTVVDGILGDRLRAVLVVAGTYTLSTLLNVTGVVR